MLDIIRQHGGCSVRDVTANFDMSRIAVMKHLKVLEGAELVVSQKEGRTRHLYVNMAPIQMIYDRWTTEFSSLWAGRVTRIKYAVERSSKRSSRRTKKGTKDDKN